MVYVVFVKTIRYPTDLTDSQWLITQHLIPADKPGGRPRSLDMRLAVDAILHLTVGGIQWRMLPTCLTAMGHGNCSDEAAVSARNCVSSGLTAPFAAHGRDGLRSVFAFAFSLSSSRKNKRVSPYCPVVGWWNAPSLGLASIVASTKTVHDCPKAVSPLSISL